MLFRCDLRYRTVCCSILDPRVCCCCQARRDGLKSMRRFGNKVKNVAVFSHRWMGVVFCSLFFLWFASGMVMMYCEYPMVSEASRLRHLQVLNSADIRLSPQDAYAQLQTDIPPSNVRIDMFDGRPVYRFDNGFEESMVYADDGQRLDTFTPEMTLRIASAWGGQSPAASIRISCSPM